FGLRLDNLRRCRSRLGRSRLRPPRLQDRLRIELGVALRADNVIAAEIVKPCAAGLASPLQTPIGLRHCITPDRSEKRVANATSAPPVSTHRCWRMVQILLPYPGRRYSAPGTCCRGGPIC